MIAVRPRYHIGVAVPKRMCSPPASRAGRPAALLQRQGENRMAIDTLRGRADRAGCSVSAVLPLLAGRL